MIKMETRVSSGIQRKTVMIKREEKNQEHQKIGIVNHLYIDKENTIRVTQLRFGKKLIDRPIQLLYPMQLQHKGITTTNEDGKKNELNFICNGVTSKADCFWNRKVAVKGHCYSGKLW